MGKFTHWIGIGLLMLCMPAVLRAQGNQARRDSLKALKDTMNVYVYDQRSLLQDGIFTKVKAADSSLANFHMYNPVTRKYHAFLSDNIGRPIQPAFYEPDSIRGFSIGRPGSTFFHFRGGEQPFYRTKRAYSVLGYTLGTAGQKKGRRVGEQTMHILHTQPINQTLQLGFEFKRITSAGFYQRQWTAHSNIRAFASYLAKQENYGIVAEFVFNDSKLEENGGLSDNVNFKESEITNLIDGVEVVNSLTRKFGYPVNLPAAMNQHQNYELFVKQFYRVGVKSYQPDTNKTPVKLPLFQVDNTFRIKTDRQRFIDSSANGFFDQYLIDSSRTFYRTYWRQMDTDLEFSFYPYRKKGLANKVSAGISAAVFDVNQDSVRFVNYNVSLFSRLNFFIDSLRYIRVFGEYNLLGYNQNDLYLKANLFAGFNNKKKELLLYFEPAVFFRLQEPGYLLQYTNSNQFFWTNNFAKIRTLGVTADVNFPKYGLKLGGRFFNTGNAIYFDSLAIVRQASQEVVIFQALAEYDLAFSKKRFHFVNRFVYQTANSDIMRLAPFYLKSSFYYENFLFKKALFLQAGFDIYYGLGYEGYGYNAANGSFFLQAQNARIGNYPYLDVYVSARIKRFKLFLHAGHLNQGFPKPAYFTTARYPMQDRSFRIGFSWGLFN